MGVICFGLDGLLILQNTENECPNYSRYKQASLSYKIYTLPLATLIIIPIMHICIGYNAQLQSSIA